MVAWRHTLGLVSVALGALLLTGCATTTGTRTGQLGVQHDNEHQVTPS
jgi:outer membrane biogenesis lipoprotein LolB